MPFGLHSTQGKLLNGRIGEVQFIDNTTNRAAVSFDPRHPETTWKKIKVTRLHKLDGLTDIACALEPSEECHCLKVQSPEWQQRISKALRIHEQIFLACTCRFMLKEMAAIRPQGLAGKNKPKDMVDIALTYATWCEYTDEDLIERDRRVAQAFADMNCDEKDYYSGDQYFIDAHGVTLSDDVLEMLDNNVDVSISYPLTIKFHYHYGRRFSTFEDLQNEGTLDSKKDDKVLRNLAISLLCPSYCEKVLTFEARPKMVEPRAMYLMSPAKFAEAQKNNMNIHECYSQYFSGVLDASGITSDWDPIAIDGNTFERYCGKDLEEDIESVVAKALPFSITFARSRNLDQLFQERCASQGGPIMVTAMHVGARLGDTSLCRMLHNLGASMNPNILIPNDQDSYGGEPNRADGSDFSQYRWGYITPMRLAHTYGNVSAASWFRQNGGDLGVALRTHLPGRDPSLQDFPTMLGSSFARIGAVGFHHLPRGACWTNAEENAIYYLNTYMNGERQYPNELYESDYVGPGALLLDRVKSDDSTSECEEQVTQECVHNEPPAVPDPLDAAVANELWVQDVERRIAENLNSYEPSLGHAQTLPTDVWIDDLGASSSADLWDHDSPQFGDPCDRIFIVRFSRSVKDLFPARLHTGRELEPVRAAAKEHDQECLLKSGASIFVYPTQYGSIKSVLQEHTLRRHHVVVAEAFLPLIYQEIIQIPSKSNIKPVGWKLLSLVDDEQEMVCVVEHGFLRVVPSKQDNREEVTQSTSEVHGCPNVRRNLLP